MDKGFIERVKAEPCDDIVLEDRRIKSYGDNYQSLKIKNKINLRKLLLLIFCFLIVSGIALFILVLCGI